MHLFNRNPRTTLPSLVQSLPTVAETKNFGRLNRKEGKEFSSIDPDTIVRMRVNNDKDWDKKGIVVAKCPEPRSYDILNEKGNIVRCNRRHLIPCHDEFHIQPDYDPPQPNQLRISSESFSNEETRTQSHQSQYPSPSPSPEFSS